MTCRNHVRLTIFSRWPLWLVAVTALALQCAPALRFDPPTQMQAWLVYFDAERGLDEVREHGDLFDRISLFAYELTPDGRPRPAPGVAQMIPRFLRLAEETGYSPWVTVVNDVRFSRDSAILKDPYLVHDVIANPVRRGAHAIALAEEVESDGFAGLHLDYEQVFESDSLEFRSFVDELRHELERRGLGLEVVVEPSHGPLPHHRSASVSIMGYDLYGSHSGPGPRATPEFVAGLKNRAAGDADGAAGLAIAVGGFAWDPDGGVRTIDWSATDSLESEAARSSRAEPSMVPNAEFPDGTEVWFEDPESLRSKWEAASTAGFRRLLLWRLGGNDERLFSFLRDLRRGR